MFNVSYFRDIVICVQNKLIVTYC